MSSAIEPPFADGAAGDEPRAQVIVGNQDRAGLREREVAAGVIGVVVGIDDEAQRPVSCAEPPKRGADPVRERRKLIGHQQHAVRAHGRADIAASPLQQVEVVGEPGGLDLDPAHVLLLGRRGARKDE
jgi:hypothetical protein